MFGIGASIALLEFAGGWASNSLALISDAFHVLTDMAAGAISIIVARAVRKNIGSGIKLRGIGGLASGIFLAAAAFWIFFQAGERLLSSKEVAAPAMIAFAFLGAIGNYIQHRILDGARVGHVTHRAMVAHVFSDLWQSVGVVLAGFAIWATGWTFVDPLASLAVGLAMVFWAVRIVRESRALLRRST